MPPEANLKEPDLTNQAIKKTSLCWNCASDASEPIFIARDFDTALQSFPIRSCSQCGLVYSANIGDGVLEAAYSRAYYGSEKAKFVPVVEAIVRFGQRRQAQSIIKKYRRNAGAKATNELAVLDIGCGRGLLLQAFAQLGANCLGIERDEFPGSKPKGVELHVGSVSDSALTGRRFDIIVIWHVLEHITDLGQLFDELPKHLNPGGLLVISVPNFSSWQSQLFKRHWFHLDIPRHVTHFEKPWLDEKLSELGLVVVDSNTFTATQNVYGFLQSTLNAIFPEKPNRLYHLLTRGRGARERVSLIGWGVLAAALMPIAILETILAELAGRGATLTSYAIKEKQRKN
ncbi:MAG: class I SAM-dependent methyltransferase [Halioglobus sp.]